MRIFLTGSNGFLGSALARHWASKGHELCLLVRPGSNTRRINDLLSVTTLVRASGVEDVMAAVYSFAPEAIVHTACCYGRAGESPLEVLDANLRLGTGLLEAAVKEFNGRTRTVFLNTGTVLAPDVSLYAMSKNQFSSWGAALARQHAHRLQFIDIRLQQMYGPGDDRSKFTTHIIESCRLNEARLALTPGEQRRDFIHIDDVVQAYDAILTGHNRLAVADGVDVGSGDAVRMRDFVELVHRLTSASTRLEFGAVPYRPTEAMLCVADTTRLRELGWTPRFDLESGLRQTIAHFFATSDEQ